MDSTSTNNPSRLTLAHLSDPHLSTLDHLSWRQLLGKPLLGYLSWQRRRQYIHRPQRLALLCQDMQQQQPDHIVVSGDLTQLGSAPEYRQATHWLHSLGRPEQVTVVPGNHDCYTAAGHDLTRQDWRDFICSDFIGSDNGQANTDDPFPLLRRRGPVDIIGLNSAIPTGCSQATGRLGEHQLALLQQQLAASAAAGQCRLLVIHHPPQPGAVSRRKRLLDAEELAKVLDKEGAELIIHGHSHHNSFDRWRAVPVLGISSASSTSEHVEAMAAYHLIDIERLDGAGWQLRINRRRIPASSAIYSEQIANLTLPKPGNT